MILFDNEFVKDVVGYSDLFCITSAGRVYSKRTNKFLKFSINDSGYHTISTKIGGRCGTCVVLRVHRMVADAFIPNVDNKPYVNHIDGNKRNNFVENLEWVTQQENMQHASTTGLLNIKRGIESNQSKLSIDQVKEIRNNPKISIRKFAGIFGVGKEAVRRCRVFETYNDIVQ